MSRAFAVSFTPRAAREVADAKRWWRANRTKAPDALEEELRTVLELVATNPNIGGVARNARLGGVRRVFLNRVNYFLYYRAQAEQQVIEVVALWHARRGSAPRL